MILLSTSFLPFASAVESGVLIRVIWDKSSVIKDHDGVLDNTDEVYMKIVYTDDNGISRYESTEIINIDKGTTVAANVQKTLDYNVKLGSKIYVRFYDADTRNADDMIFQAMYDVTFSMNYDENGVDGDNFETWYRLFTL